MELIGEGIREAFRLIFTGDGQVYAIAARSLAVSGVATAIGLTIGSLLGLVLGTRSFVGRNLVLSLVNTGMALPPVVVGLFVFMVLVRDGPLGRLHLLFTPAAMVLAQAIIVTPIVTALTAAAIQGLHPRLRLQILALGASRWQWAWLMFKEARLPLLAAVMLGFGAAIHEVGASLMVGGNIKDETRVLTTATVLETQKGNFETAIALSVILLLVMYAVNLALTLIQQRRRPL
ncbi:MAG: ABC transporter permease [Chloroflexi bacterium]|nr:ABC transporter permease [Chloroflexota bacterium]